MNRTKIAVAAGLLTMLPSVAFAHPGMHHIYSMLAGVEHPITGLDHILAMVAVGVWAAQKGGRALWVWPAAFVSIMLVGGVLGMEGIVLPFIEPAIASSILILGLLIASATMLPVSAGALLIGAFALFHGNAHGLEAPASEQGLMYAIGFVLATASLHGIGLAIGRVSSGEAFARLLRASGAVTTCIGGILLLA